MLQSLCILGRQPALGLAELESLYGADKLQSAGEQAVLLDVTTDQVEFSRLGGTIKLCNVLNILPYASWRDIETYLVKTVPEHLDYLAAGKLQLGLSAYGFTVSAHQLQATGLNLKRIIKEAGRSVRLVPNEQPELNSAQVLHNHLTGPLGWELILVKDGTRTILAQTTAVQDITGYAKRDQARPKRDARVGMLPPKLAQIIVNLALGQIGRQMSDARRSKIGNRISDIPVVLDPFCGTGVILQEALLMGYDVCGTDLERRMAEYSLANIEWLRERYPDLPGLAAINQGDATNHQWPYGISAVATETYLGRPLSFLPAPGDLQQIVSDVNTIHRKFLQNLAKQTKPGFRLCLAVPAWKLSDIRHPQSDVPFRRLPVLDRLTDMGYNRVSFTHARNDDLIYHRPNQLVARELVVLKRA